MHKHSATELQQPACTPTLQFFIYTVYFLRLFLSEIFLFLIANIFNYNLTQHFDFLPKSYYYNYFSREWLNHSFYLWNFFYSVNFSLPKIFLSPLFLIKCILTLSQAFFFSSNTEFKYIWSPYLILYWLKSLWKRENTSNE